MTTTTGNTYAYHPADQEHTRHVLLQDDRGRLTLGRLRPWHRVLARYAASRLDRELAAGASPENSARLAARAVQLTSMKVRRNLAASIRRILAAVGDPAEVTVITARPARLPLARARIRQSAGPLAVLASYLAAPGPVPAQGVAMVSQLLANGVGPLYREASVDDLGDLIDKATRALAR
jgi:hypothetical protein